MTVLACIDGSRFTASVCDYAVRAARRIGGGVTLLHAIERAPGYTETIDRSGVMTANMADETLEAYTRLNEERRRLEQEQGHLLLDQAGDRVRAGGVEIDEKRLVFGSLVDGVRDFDAEARFVVVGKRGQAETQAPNHLGTNLERVVRASRHPILIVPAEVRPLRRFLVAYDGGASTAKVIDTLMRETLLLEAECHLLMVGSATDEHRAQLASARDALRSVGYTVMEMLRPGHADEEILSALHEIDADLLVMGAYGHTRVRELIIGSTTTALLRASTIPVLVIR